MSVRSLAERMRAVATRRRALATGVMGLAATGSGAQKASRERTSKTSALHPGPTFIPAGYRLVAQYLNIPDGFGGESDELVLTYHQSTSRPSGFAYPLQIFTTSSPRRLFLDGAQDRAPTKMRVDREGGGIEADYYDGMWWLDPNGERLLPDGYRVTWKRDCHSLVFRLGEMMVGIRGYRSANIQVDDLLAIAVSIK